MYVKAKNLSRIEQNGIDTYYLYAGNEKIILPVDTPADQGVIPKPSDTIKRILALFGSAIAGIKIYKERGQNYYTYLSLSRNGRIFDVNIHFRDGMELADSAKCPIFIKQEVLREQGIKVTKSMIREALSV